LKSLPPHNLKLLRTHRKLYRRLRYQSNNNRRQPLILKNKHLICPKRIPKSNKVFFQRKALQTNSWWQISRLRLEVIRHRENGRRAAIMRKIKKIQGIRLITPQLRIYKNFLLNIKCPKTLLSSLRPPCKYPAQNSTRNLYLLALNTILRQFFRNEASRLFRAPTGRL
jgi:hypothetical protein